MHTVGSLIRLNMVFFNFNFLCNDLLQCTHINEGEMDGNMIFFVILALGQIFFY